MSFQKDKLTLSFWKDNQRAMSAPDDRRRRHADFLATRRIHWPASITPVAQLMTAVFRLSDLTLRASSGRVATLGLTFSEFEVLATLRGFPSAARLTPGELSAAILLTSGGLTKVLRTLEEKGLVLRPDGAADRRSKPVALTAKGRRLVEKAMAEILRADTELIEGAIASRELETLNRLLAKALDAAERDAEERNSP